jgi:hypothetical protein
MRFESRPGKYRSPIDLADYGFVSRMVPTAGGPAVKVTVKVIEIWVAVMVPVASHRAIPAFGFTALATMFSWPGVVVEVISTTACPSSGMLPLNVPVVCVYAVARGTGAMPPGVPSTLPVADIVTVALAPGVVFAIVTVALPVEPNVVLVHVPV